MVTASEHCRPGMGGPAEAASNGDQDYDEQIDELAQAHPDYALIKSFPGAGPAMPRG